MTTFVEEETTTMENLLLPKVIVKLNCKCGKKIYVPGTYLGTDPKCETCREPKPRPRLCKCSKCDRDMKVSPAYTGTNPQCDICRVIANASNSRHIAITIGKALTAK